MCFPLLLPCALTKSTFKDGSRVKNKSSGTAALVSYNRKQAYDRGFGPDYLAHHFADEVYLDVPKFALLPYELVNRLEFFLTGSNNNVIIPSVGTIGLFLSSLSYSLF